MDIDAIDRKVQRLARYLPMLEALDRRGLPAPARDTAPIGDLLQRVETGLADLDAAKKTFVEATAKVEDVLKRAETAIDAMATATTASEEMTKDLANLIASKPADDKVEAQEPAAPPIS